MFLILHFSQRIFHTAITVFHWTTQDYLTSSRRTVPETSNISAKWTVSIPFKYFLNTTMDDNAQILSHFEDVKYLQYTSRYFFVWINVRHQERGCQTRKKEGRPLSRGGQIGSQSSEAAPHCPLRTYPQTDWTWSWTAKIVWISYSPLMHNLGLTCQVQTPSGISPSLLKKVSPSWMILRRSTLHLSSWTNEVIIFFQISWFGTDKVVEI